MKDIEYYSTIRVARANKEDFKKVYVYKRGEVVFNGKPYAEVKDELEALRKSGHHVEIEEDLTAYMAEREKYFAARRALEEEFKLDLFAANNMLGHPKAEKLYAIVVNERDSRSEVRDLFEELAELFH